MNYLNVLKDVLAELNIRISLLGGGMGTLLFKDIFYEKSVGIIEKELNDYLEKVEQDKISFTFCDGLAGFSWLFNYFNGKGTIEVDMTEVFADTDQYLYKWMMNQISNGNYDYLHGAIGVGVYFLSRESDSKCIKYLSDLVDGLDRIGIKEEDGSIKFLTILNYKTGEKGYNLSLSHGISGIIVFLTRVIEKGINEGKAKKVLGGCVLYMQKHKLPSSNLYYSMFPNSVSNDNILCSSRLAWCYGDLGNGIALYQAGTITKNKEWEEFALSVLMKCTLRRDLNQNSVMDAGLCHGTAGIGHIFHRMYRYTNDNAFKEAAQFWFDETKKMAVHKDGIAGYKTWHGKDGWIKESNLLEGVSGIALALYCWENNIDPDWDRCLLLS